MNAPPPDHSILPRLARDSVTAVLSGLAAPGPAEDPTGYLHKRAGVFVTIRNRDGGLRGCRGTIEPQFENVMEETRHLALSSAFDDNRFQPVKAAELENLSFEVSVLHAPVRISGLAEIDPTRHGIIVRTRDGRRALMLPGVEGLDTAERQFTATCRKGGIRPDEQLCLERFVVDRFTEVRP